jgi:hypothetical protein
MSGAAEMARLEKPAVGAMVAASPEDRQMKTGKQLFGSGSGAGFHF